MSNTTALGKERGAGRVKKKRSLPTRGASIVEVVGSMRRDKDVDRLILDASARAGISEEAEGTGQSEANKPSIPPLDEVHRMSAEELRAALAGAERNLKDAALGLEDARVSYEDALSAVVA